MTKKQVTEVLGRIDDIDHTLEELQELFQGYPKGTRLVQNWTGYEDCDFEFHHTRLETDEEYKDRLELEAEIT